MTTTPFSGTQVKQVFLEHLKTTVEARLDDPCLGVDDLCAAVHLSRAQLHRRLKDASGLSASLFIRTVRLERARDLLQQGRLNVTQVAFEVGFEDPSFFTRVFTLYFGKSPRVVRKSC